MSIVFAGLSPHPPLLIPEIGRRDRERVSLTDQALKKLAGLLTQSKPDVLVIISPHGPVFSDAIAILHKHILKGDFGQFGAPHVSFTEEIDLEFITEIEKTSREQDIMVVLMGDKECKQYNITGKLDHGVMVPLYYFREFGLDAPLVPITMGMLPYEDLYRFGALLTKVSKKLDKKIAVIASGDLSHRLTPEAPAGYNPHGKEFDEFLVKALKKYKVEDLFELDPKLIEKAGECGLRPIIIMLGALDGLEVDSEVISYEGPFGVGYCVAAFTPTDKEIPSKIDLLYKKRSDRLKGIREKEHPLVRLARQTIANHLEGKKTSPPEELTPEMKKKAGVFVSIKKHGQLRGCIGTTAPTQENVAQEVIQNAISAAFYDPRFFPIEKDELDELTISVDVLSEPEPIESIKELDPVRYGVIVKQGNKTGLLLPDLEGIDTPEQQVEIAKRKAGIITDDNIKLYRFKVTRYH
ncbi:AMMECR1 domain-containing protein [Anoxybacter fermentans]|uniref:AMMECR1 domain-containing protein n=1 Tax=Anoxybacter fermentans TaxID=1323375 RepID=A0A3Q9HPT7_9FIRM|nr:AmmeMemoRadiSam system protein A [Anoxybacter fermentans]AZR71934.1 AMMECR1 domain-containing protein [Anoxybacter fermentans]